MLLTLFRYLDYTRNRRRNSSSIFRRHEEFSLNPLPLRTGDSELPTYEQAVSSDGQHNVPPPPYPGPPKGRWLFRKSMSLPGPQSQTSFWGEHTFVKSVCYLAYCKTVYKNQHNQKRVKVPFGNRHSPVAFARDHTLHKVIALRGGNA